MTSPLLSIAYLPPVQYFCKLLPVPLAEIEACEHFSKQNYRSRCHILGANGVQILSIPVEKVHGQKRQVREVRIDYQTPWQQQHWRALEAAYNGSPFFEHYADELHPFFERRETFLFDFNYLLLQKMAECLELRVQFALTQEYCPTAENDFRTIISPKPSQYAEDHEFCAAEYYQVFTPKFGFVPNLSIVDLLFNEGNNALSLLQQSVRPVRSATGA